jgi:hypothetical protein
VPLTQGESNVTIKVAGESLGNAVWKFSSTNPNARETDLVINWVNVHHAPTGVTPPEVAELNVSVDQNAFVDPSSAPTPRMLSAGSSSKDGAVTIDWRTQITAISPSVITQIEGANTETITMSGHRLPLPPAATIEVQGSSAVHVDAASIQSTETGISVPVRIDGSPQPFQSKPVHTAVPLTVVVVFSFVRGGETSQSAPIQLNIQLNALTWERQEASGESEKVPPGGHRR